jgi:hypothetical protein
LDDDVEDGDDSDYDVEDVDVEGDEDLAAEDGLDDLDIDNDEDEDIDDSDLAPEDGEGDEGDIELELDGDEEGDIESRMTSLEEKLDTILNAIQNMKYDDDEPLYDDEDSDGDDDFNDEDEEDDDTPEIAESRSYRRMRKLNEDRLNVFGKHPAYQKTVMTLPNPDMEDTDGKYDMNDKGSIPGNRPYGTRKGSSAPYTEPADQDVDAITESVLRILKKKLAN